MKAFDVLMVVNRFDMRQGKDYMDLSRNGGCSLEIKEGKLLRNHWYFLCVSQK